MWLLNRGCVACRSGGEKRGPQPAGRKRRVWSAGCAKPHSRGNQSSSRPISSRRVSCTLPIPGSPQQQTPLVLPPLSRRRRDGQRQRRPSRHRLGQLKSLTGKQITTDRNWESYPGCRDALVFVLLDLLMSNVAACVGVDGDITVNGVFAQA